MFERLKTNTRIAADIVRGRALPETLIPAERNHVELVITRADGSTDYTDGWNARTAAGAQWQAQVMGQAVGTPALYVALSTILVSAANGDLTLAGEVTTTLSASGLMRAAGTYQTYQAQPALLGSASYQIYHLYTSDCTATIQSAALFNQLANGTMFVEAQLSPAATLAPGDSIALTWTVNI